ncbi:hypothetical protein LTR56_024182 [Elasticomyces elasticus]|nr:hypothetical protein LTR56_024182 [Elasticomyces elasticus]KAK3640575.1 hypothetical protein LTR22_016951 [Elasticomyces elasticus]KAK4910207.1 hypothetical protein LTR49_021098 [Elasticomyces elasticus]KAK5759963.1 hypothetical protein LTS12_009859 [Elasticomyces elasticus]
MASVDISTNPPTSSKLPLRPRDADTEPETQATGTPGLCLFDLSLELRWEIYSQYLADLLSSKPQEVRIARHHRSKLDFRAALDSVKLHMPTALLRSCHAINNEINDAPKHELISPYVNYVVEVKDLDFSLLIKFTKWLVSKDNRFAKLVDLTQPGKFVAELSFTRANDVDGDVLGRWLKNVDKLGLHLEYRVKEIERPVETMFEICRLSVGLPGNFNGLTEAVLEHTKMLHVEAARVEGGNDIIAGRSFDTVLGGYLGCSLPFKFPVKPRDSDGLWPLPVVRNEEGRAWPQNWSDEGRRMRVLDGRGRLRMADELIWDL